MKTQMCINQMTFWEWQIVCSWEGTQPPRVRPLPRICFGGGVRRLGFFQEKTFVVVVVFQIVSWARTRSLSLPLR